jgi:serine/threonine-protein kinase RIO1
MSSKHSVRLGQSTMAQVTTAEESSSHDGFSKDAEQHQQEQEQGDDDDDQAEPTPPVPPMIKIPPKKTWAIPKPPGKSKDDTASDDEEEEEKDGRPILTEEKKSRKKSLLEIMAEEAQQAENDKKLKEQHELERRIAQEEEKALMQALKASMATMTVAAASEAAAEFIQDDMDEDMKLAFLLSLQDGETGPAAAAGSAAASATSVPPAAAAAAAATATAPSGGGLTEAELLEIEKALQEADAAEAAQSFHLAVQLHQQEGEELKQQAAQRKLQPQGNVRTMNRADFLHVQGKGDNHKTAGDEYNDCDEEDEEDDLIENTSFANAGFRINSSKPSSSWLRVDGATIVGPNQEVRTKHDLQLQGQANAFRLDAGRGSHVGNQAYNAFHSQMKRKTVKGVAAQGHGRATTDTTDKTRDGALDGRVRLQIARAVNSGFLDTFHGCVKEGKEALVFYATQGRESDGFDVAVKVFKRIQEFKNRIDYVAGDPRYRDGENYKNAGPRQQLELWAEKEYRNLVRAYRAQVPVPKPLWQNENVLLLRFLGENGWPSPQLRELSSTLKRGSRTWSILYEQTMTAVQRLYCDAGLVHGDLSEYNVMVCPGRLLRRVEGETVGEAPLPPGDGNDDHDKKPSTSSKKDNRKQAPIDPSDDATKKTPASTTTDNRKQAPNDDAKKTVAGKNDNRKQAPVDESDDQKTGASSSDNRKQAPIDESDDQKTGASSSDNRKQAPIDEISTPPTLAWGMGKDQTPSLLKPVPTAAVSFSTETSDDVRKPAPSSFQPEHPPQAAVAGNTIDDGGDDDESLQIVLIDFGQAVRVLHGGSEELLQRDLLRVKQFFDKMGIPTISVEAAMSYVQTKDALFQVAGNDVQ